MVIIIEKTTPDKRVPVSENPAIEEQSQELYQRFIDKIDTEMESYTDYILKMDKREIFGMATDIAMRQEITESIKNNEYEFDNADLEFLISYDDLLDETAGILKGITYEGMAVNGDVKDILRDIISENFHITEHSVDTDLSGSEPGSMAAIPEVTERQLYMQKWFSDMIDGNMTDAVKQCMSMEKADIINMASKLTAMEDVKTFFDSKDILFKQNEYEYLCQYHDPLEIIADRWYEQSRGNTVGIMETVKDILDKRDIGNEYKYAYFVSPHEVHSIPEKTKKPSILADLAEKLKEIKPPSPQNKKYLEIE